MERALVRLIGAGLTSVMPGFGIAVPAGAIEGGFALIDGLSRGDAPTAVALLDRLVQALWQQWQCTGLPPDVADRHMMALPAMMERNRPSAKLLRTLLVAAQTRPLPLAGAADIAPARQLAAETIVLTRQSGDIARAGLDEAIVFMLLDWLYTALAAEGAGIDAVRPMCAAYLQQGGWLAPAARANTPPPPAGPTLPEADPAPGTDPSPSPRELRPAIIARLTQTAVATLRATVELRRNKLPDVEAAAAMLADLLTKLIDRVAADAARSSYVGRELGQAAQCLADGAFAEADHAFSNAEQRLIQLAQTEFGMARDRMRAAAEVLECRAELEEIRFEFRKAARHYRSAMRCFAKPATARQWQYLMRQAQALLHQDEINQDETALSDAAIVLAEAGQLRPEQVGPLVWAAGEARLASFLIDLGLREKSQHRFAEAVQHARAACGVLAVEQTGPAWLQSQQTLARALWLQGDLVGDASMVGEAAVACRLARDQLARETDPENWVAATALLGQILLRQATVTGLDAEFAEATENLRAALQFAELAQLPLDTVHLEACLGRSLLAQFSNTDQPLLLDLAATAFRRAIKAAHTKGAFKDKAIVQHELGLTLWAMAERVSDRSSLEAAVEALQRSAVALDNLGELQRADEVRRDIGRLRDVAASK